MLVGDAVLSLGMATMADRLGRQRMLVAGAGLMIFGGLVFGLTSNLVLLLIATIVCTFSPTGAELGPFSSIEQAALTQTTSDAHRTQVFAWYHLVGAFTRPSSPSVGVWWHRRCKRLVARRLRAIASCSWFMPGWAWCSHDALDRQVVGQKDTVTKHRQPTICRSLALSPCAQRYVGGCDKTGDEAQAWEKLRDLLMAVG
jgi:MFS family permease